MNATDSAQESPKDFRIALAGCGPHAHRVYLKLIQKYLKNKNLVPGLLIDLKSKKSKVESFLKDISYTFDEIIYLDDSELTTEYFSPKNKEILNKALKQHKIDGIIISTEPKAHKKYCLLAMENDLCVLMDKPITSPINSSTSEKGAQKIKTDYLEILKAKKKSKGKIVVQCQRRYHDGYIFVVNYLIRFIKEFKVPITYLDIFHSDGCWNMFNEFYERENHPYKYGYGKLMHSGYHFIDLLAWFLSVNKHAVSYDTICLQATPLKPSDLNYQLSKLLPKVFEESAVKRIYNKYNLNHLKKFGELDTYCKVFLYEKGNLVTSANLDLLQNAFSRRSWSDLPRDTYKGNGRVRHERINIEIGPLLNIQLHSYQAYETGKPEKITGMGNIDHFEIYIYRNSGLVGGKSFEKYDFGEKDRAKNKKDPYYLGHNERARNVAFLNFLSKNDSGTSIEDQCLTIDLMTALSSSQAKNYNTKNNSIKKSFSLKNYND
jgi:predicted dehydrogenase